MNIICCPKNITIALKNVLGQTINSLKMERQNTGTHASQMLVNDLPNGIYYLKMNFGELMHTEKLFIGK
ncbi:MAG: T9SS type A sorting domain-containing protein [Bacteroidota bacterium]